MSNYNKLKAKLEEIELLSESTEFVENFEEMVYEFEEELQEELEIHDYNTKLVSLQKKLKRIKEENDFYDEEAELDMMFPNRHDDDFNEDDMSYDSVFGDD